MRFKSGGIDTADKDHPDQLKKFEDDKLEILLYEDDQLKRNFAKSLWRLIIQDKFSKVRKPRELNPREVKALSP